MQHDERDVAIVRSAIELGHRLGLRVVAEGVESGATRAQLELMSCDVLQGFLFSAPVASSDIPRLYADAAEPPIARSA